MKKSTKPKAAWTRAFPDQAKALRPEKSPAGGVKARSGSEEARMKVYLAIRHLFLTANTRCKMCSDSGNFNFASQVHHKSGRAGLLLFDVRYFMPLCEQCHRWVHDNPEVAAKLGLLIKR